MIKKISIQEKLTQCFIISCFFSLTVFFFTPIDIYFTNIFEFPLSFIHLISFLLIVASIAIIVSTGFLWCLRQTPYYIGILIVFGLSLLFWLQGNILLWDYGVFTGQAIDWNSNFLYGVIDITVWILILSVIVFKHKIIFRYCFKLSIIFVLIQVTAMTFNYLNIPDEIELKKNDVNRDFLYSFSKEQNVIVYFVDSVQSDVFFEILQEKNEFKKSFEDFIYFRNSLGGFMETMPSIPLIISGQYFNNSIPFSDFQKRICSSESIYQVLLENNFNTYMPNCFTFYCGKDNASNFLSPKFQLFSSRTRHKVFTLYSLAMFREVPHFFKQFVYDPNIVFTLNNASKNSSLCPDINFINEMVANLLTDNKKSVFQFYELWGGHPPFLMNENMQYEKLPNNRQGYKQQVTGVLRMANKFIKLLKEKDVYDNTMILIVSDTGAHQPVNLKNTGYEGIFPADINFSKGGALPLILIKPFFSKGNLIISDLPVTLRDIPKTICEELSLKNNFPGISMLKNKKIPLDRKRLFFGYQNTVSGQPGWGKNYAPDLYEYIVSGFSWDNSAWTQTGRILTKSGVDSYDSPKLYHFGSIIQFGKSAEDSASEYLKTGWHSAGLHHTWTKGKEAHIFIPINTPISDLEATFLIRHIFNGKQKINVYINGTNIGMINVTERGSYQIKIPKSLVTGPILKITLHIPDSDEIIWTLYGIGVESLVINEVNYSL